MNGQVLVKFICGSGVGSPRGSSNVEVESPSESGDVRVGMSSNKP